MNHPELDALLPQCRTFDPSAAIGEFAKALPAHGGVYLLCDEQDRAIQLSATQGLRRAIIHRLTTAADQPSKRADLRTITRRVRFAPGYSQFETSLIFLRTAYRLYPREYREMLDFGPSWFIHVNVQDHLPRLVPSERWADRPGQLLGPFPDRSACSRYIALLEDLFELCRDYHILQQVPHGQPCAYWEMGRCPAPCNGSISLDEYRQMVAQAAEFHGQARGRERDAVQPAMKAAAGRLDYEQAGRLRQRLERVEQTLAKPFRRVQDAGHFRWLAVQRAGGRRRLRAFFVRGPQIETGPITALRQLPDVWPEWCRQLASDPPSADAAAGELHIMQVWLVCHYLFKPPAAAGLFFPSHELSDPQAALQRVSERFAPPRAKPGSPEGH